mmetsp:Transcript_17497/g.33458  ORF Transcript_17497/g.33458 Transcript_17497/m.33458 type:complete len:388 (+) Transcript_17497:733-1896(+)
MQHRRHALLQRLVQRQQWVGLPFTNPAQLAQHGNLLRLRARHGGVVVRSGALVGVVAVGAQVAVECEDLGVLGVLRLRRRALRPGPQRFRHLGKPVLAGQGERGEAVLSLARRGVRARLQQHLHQGQLLVLGRQHQRAGPQIVPVVHIRAGGQQQLDHVQRARLTARNQQGRGAFAVLGVGVGPSVQEQFGQRGASRAGSHHEWRAHALQTLARVRSKLLERRAHHRFHVIHAVGARLAVHLACHLQESDVVGVAFVHVHAPVPEELDGGVQVARDHRPEELLGANGVGARRLRRKQAHQPRRHVLALFPNAGGHRAPHCRQRSLLLLHGHKSLHLALEELGSQRPRQLLGAGERALDIVERRAGVAQLQVALGARGVERSQGRLLP